MKTQKKQNNASSLKWR